MLLKTDYYADYFPTFAEMNKYYHYNDVPFLYFHFSFMFRSVIVARYRHKLRVIENRVASDGSIVRVVTNKYESCKFGVFVRGWLPDVCDSHYFPKSKYEFCKEWHVVFASAQLSNSVLRFKQLVKELLFKYSINTSDLCVDKDL